MTAPRAPPHRIVVPGPTPHASNASSSSRETRSTWLGGNLGSFRSGASIMWPLTTTTAGASDMVDTSICQLRRQRAHKYCSRPDADITEPPSDEQTVAAETSACRELIAEGVHDGYRGL